MVTPATFNPESTPFDELIWDQKVFEPVTGRAVCHIHFKFPDGSRIQKGFTSNLRLWFLRYRV